MNSLAEPHFDAPQHVLVVLATGEPKLAVLPGMAHGHSAMNHPAVVPISLVMISQSCQTSCVNAERLNASREIVPQVTVVQTAAAVLDSTAEFLDPDFTAAWGLDSGPPAPLPVQAARFPSFASEFLRFPLAAL